MNAVEKVPSPQEDSHVHLKSNTLELNPKHTILDDDSYYHKTSETSTMRERRRKDNTRKLE